MRFLHKIKFITISKLFIVTILIVICSLSIYSFCYDNVLFENTTTSGPRGVYLRAFIQNISYGDWIVVTPPSSLIKKPLLKQAQGFSQDVYTVSNSNLIIHNKKYPIYHMKGLNNIIPGKYFVPENTILCLNDMDLSYDSRYLGPIDIKDVGPKVWLIYSYEPFYKMVASIKDIRW